MDAAKQARTLAKSQFTRSLNALEKVLSINDLPLPTIERKFNDFVTKWNTVQEAHDKFALFEGEMNKGEKDNLEPWLSELIDKFDTLEMDADRIIEEKKKAMNPVPPSLQPQHVPAEVESPQLPQQNIIKIEPLKFKAFEGDIRMYPQFKQDFCAYIRPRCSESQLGFILKRYLCDKVREDVESCGDDYVAIWKRLDQRYGNVGHLIRRILNDIQVLPVGRFDSTTTLRMISVVDKAHRDLVQIGAEEEMCNATIIAMIEKRMSSMMYQEWLKEISGKSHVSEDKFKMLIELLHDWRNRLEYESGGIMVPEVTAKVHYAAEPESAPKGTFTHSCWLHKREGDSGILHPIWNCSDFLHRPKEEKVKLVKKYRACMMCLLTTCDGAEDTSRCKRVGFRCRQPGCKELHNRLLHPPAPTKIIEGTSSHVADSEGTILQIQSL